MIDITIIAERCREITDGAYQRATAAIPDAGVAEIYAAVNCSTARLIDDTRETFAEYIPGDEVFRQRVERFILSACHRCAAELVVALNQGARA